jgi:dTMP kinase
MQRPRGKLIVLEGIDGAGTTTQAARLAARFGSSHLTREPSIGPIGQELRKLLGNADQPMDRAAIALLFAADRLDHLRREIEPILDEGRPVVSDRYVLSSLAYQSVDLPIEWVRAINSRARPADLTILLEVPAELAAERRRLRGGADELYDALSFQKKVVDSYRRQADEQRRQGHTVVDVDGTNPPDEVFSRLVEIVEPFLAGR